MSPAIRANSCVPIRRSRSRSPRCSPSACTSSPATSSTSSASSRIIAGHLSLVDEVLESLVHHQEPPSRAGLRPPPRPYAGLSASRCDRRLIEAHDLVARLRKPPGVLLVEVDDHVRRARPDLAPCIEHPGRADAVDPRASLAKRRLVNVAGEHLVGAVGADPLRQRVVTDAAWYRSSSAAIRPAAHGRPTPTRRPRRCASRASCSPTSAQLAGPSHHGQIVIDTIADLDQVAVGRHAQLAYLRHPARHALAALGRAR